MLRHPVPIDRCVGLWLGLAAVVAPLAAAAPCDSPPVSAILSRVMEPQDASTLVRTFGAEALIPAVAAALDECDAMPPGSPERRLALRVLVECGEHDDKGVLVLRDPVLVRALLGEQRNNPNSATPLVAPVLHSIDVSHIEGVREVLGVMLESPAAVNAGLQQIAIIRSPRLAPLLPALEALLVDPRKSHVLDGGRASPDVPEHLRASTAEGMLRIRTLAASAIIATAGIAPSLDLFEPLDEGGRLAASRAIAIELLGTRGVLDGASTTHERAAAFIDDTISNPQECRAFMDAGSIGGLLSAMASPGLDESVRARWAGSLTRLAALHPDADERIRILEAVSAAATPR